MQITKISPHKVPHYKSALQLLLYISYFLHLNGFIKKAAPKPEKETTVFIRHNIQQYFLHT